MTRRAAWTLVVGALVALGGVVAFRRIADVRPLAPEELATEHAPAAAPLSPDEVDPIPSAPIEAEPERGAIALAEPTPPPPEPLPAPGTCEVRGRTVDEEGKPVAGAEVVLTSGAAWRRAATTGDDGAFRFAGAPVNVWDSSISATRADYVPATQQLERLPSGRVANLGDLVLTCGARVSGIVIDDLDRPVADADVYWAPAVPGRLVYSTEGVCGGKSDADGRFRLEHVAAGAVRLCAVKHGYVPTWNAPIAVSSEHPTGDVAVRSETAVTLHGHTRDRETGRPLEARIQFYREGERTREVASGADGRFQADQLLEGAAYTLGAKAPGVANAQVWTSSSGGNVIEVTDFTVSNGLEIQLQTRPDRSTESRSVRVTDAGDGRPIADAIVGIAMWQTTEGAQTLQVHEVLSRTDAGGVARVPSRLGDREVLVASAPGYRTERVPEHHTEAKELAVTLARGFAIRVLAVGLEGPIARASIEIAEQLRSSSQRHQGIGADDAYYSIVGRATTDERGEAEFAGLTSLYFRVRARSSDGRGAAQIVKLGDQLGVTEVELRLLPLASISGRLDAGGSLSGRHAVVAVADDRSTFSTSADMEGHFELAALDPGAYSVAVVRCLHGTLARHVNVRLDSERRPIGMAVSIAPGEHRELVIPVPGGAGALSGIVRVNGRGASGRFVRLEWSGEQEAASTHFRAAGELAELTDSAGAFRFDGLPPGRWSLSVPRDGQGLERWPLVSTEVCIADGAVDSASFDVEVGALDLRLIDADSGTSLNRGLPLELIPVDNASDLPKPPRRGAHIRRVLGNTSDVLRLLEVEPGLYRAATPGREAWSQAFEVIAGVRQEVTCEFRRKR